MPIIKYDILDSTQAQAKRLLTENKTPPFAVQAQQQTQGRGRLNRLWHSSPNGNIYLSYVISDHLLSDKISLISLATGLALKQCLDFFCELAFIVKWPNDIYYQHKKIAGILCEYQHQNDAIIIGIGININSEVSDYPEDLQNKLSTLKTLKQKNFDLPIITSKLLELIESEKTILQNNSIADYCLRYNRLSNFIGQKVSYTDSENTIIGSIQGLNSQAELIILDEKQKPHPVIAGDVLICTK